MNPGMIPTLASSGVIIPGQFGPIILVIFSGQKLFDFDHIAGWNALGYGNNYFDPGIGRFHDSVRSKGRRNENYRYIRISGLNCFLYGIENWPVEMCLATFSRCNTTHNIGSVLDHLAGMKSTFRSGKSLNNYL